MKQVKNKYKLFYQFNITTLSPISIGNTDSINTQHDILIRNDGTPFVPASTLSGCFFSKRKKAKEFYQISSNNEITKSNLFVSDGLVSNYYIVKRDGIKLNYETKTTARTAKFDYEALEKGTKISFFIEYTSTDDTIKPIQIKEDILDICSLINGGEYRIGYKQNRGFGKLKIDSLYYKEINFDNFDIKEYEQFLSSSNELLNESMMEKIDTIISKTVEKKIIANLTPKSPFIVRVRSRIDGEADNTSLVVEGSNSKEGVIPGTSINGALRSYIYKLALKDGNSNLIDKKNHQLSDAFSLQYVIDDIYVPGNLMLKVRTKVNSFTGGGDSHSLFNEEVFVPNNIQTGIDEEITLSISIKSYKDETHVNYMIKAVKALCLGLISLGGETSIGYGLFTGKVVQNDFDEENK